MFWNVNLYTRLEDEAIRDCSIYRYISYYFGTFRNKDKDIWKEMEGRSLLPLIAGKLGREFAISEYKKSIHIMKEVEKAKMCKNKLENFFFSP